MFFTANAFEGQVHVFAGQVKIVKSLVLQDKHNIQIFLSPALNIGKLEGTTIVMQSPPPTTTKGDGDQGSNLALAKC